MSRWQRGARIGSGRVGGTRREEEKEEEKEVCGRGMKRERSKKTKGMYEEK